MPRGTAYLMTSCLGAVLALAVGAPPSAAQNDLRWKFKEGDTFFVETVTTTKQTLKNEDKPATTFDSKLTTVLKFHVTSVSSEGTVLEMTYEGTRAEGNAPAAKTAERAGNRAKGFKFKVTVAPSGKVANFEGYEAFLQALARGNEEREKAIQAELSKETLEEEMLNIFSFLPEQPVAEGATWKRAEVIRLGPRGSLIGEIEYTFKGKGEGGEQIALRNNLRFTPPTQSSPTFKDLKATVSPGTGTIVFDAQAGRLVKQDQTLRMEGSLSIINVNMTSIPFTFQQETTRSMRLLSDNPLKK